MRFATPIAVLLFGCVALKNGSAANGAEVAVGTAIAVPNGTPTELLAFIAEVKQRHPIETDYARVSSHLIQVLAAVIEAADKIAAAQANEQELTAAVSEKLAALILLRRLAAADADARLKRYLDELARDPHPFVPPLGKIYMLATRLQDLDHGNHAEIEKLVADVREHMRTARPDAKNLSLAFQTALAAERAGLTKLAVEAYQDFAKIFARSDVPDVVANAKKLDGAARLLSLPGNTLDVAGKQLDGTPFDSKQYVGKTVLVLFWATFDGPSVAELPVLKDIYDKYHDRGFEVVAVSLDTDRRRLDDFMKREQPAWPVLFGDEPQTAGWNHPLAAYYGVMGIPRAILVGKDGKVVSIDAHGEALWDLLARQIGPAVVKEPPPNTEPADKKADEKKAADQPAAKPEPKP